MDTAALKPMRKDAVRNRELLLESARAVFAQRGMDASLDDVARHAGLGVGTAYRHFENKYELLSALMDQIAGTFVANAESACALDDPWQALVTFLEQSLAAQVDDRGLREVLFGLHDPARFDEVQERVSALLNDLVERAKATGQIRADAATSDVGIMVMMLFTVADLTGAETPQLWRRYLALCLDGLKPSDTQLPGVPLTVEQFRQTLADHKQALIRGH